MTFDEKFNAIGKLEITNFLEETKEDPGNYNHYWEFLHDANTKQRKLFRACLEQGFALCIFTLEREPELLLKFDTLEEVIDQLVPLDDLVSARNELTKIIDSYSAIKT